MRSPVPEHRHGPAVAGPDGMTAAEAAEILAGFASDLTGGNLLASPVLAEHAIERAGARCRAAQRVVVDVAARTLNAFHRGAL